MPDTLTIALIGAGQLGSRYLQALSGAFRGADIYVVDPFQSSLDKAKGLLEQTGGAAYANQVLFQTGQEGLPPRLDLAIVATTADVRLTVLRSLLPGRSIAALILEKVLFQSREDLGACEELLNQYPTPTWVNCPRPIYDMYSKVKEFFGDERPRHVEVSGGEWGLTCNAVHYLDLGRFLFGASLKIVDASGVEPEWFPSKRPSFSELYGTLAGTFENGSTIRLTCWRGSRAIPTILLSGENKFCFIDELGGRVLLRPSQTIWETKEIRAPYLSEFMGPLLKDLAATGFCGLPTFAESSAIHRAFLLALEAILPQNRFPIT